MEVTFWGPTTATELGLLGIAFVLSAVVGLERHFAQKAAGIRTHVLVATGAATFTLVSAFGFAGIVGPQAVVDPSRIAAQVVSGIGFLGAGVIFTRRNAVRGLTTAATIWVSAAIGMACGAGLPVLAAAVTAIHLLVVALAPLSRRLPTRDRDRALVVSYWDGQGVLRAVLAAATEMGFAAAILATHSRDEGGRRVVTVHLRFTGRPPISDLVVTLAEIPGVVGVDSRPLSAASPLER